MVRRFPHIATVTHGNGFNTEANGDITVGVDLTNSFPCRLESSSTDGNVRSVDGTKVDFNWVVYCGKDTTVLPVGANIIILDSKGEQLCADTIKKFSQGQLNSRIWL